MRLSSAPFKDPVEDGSGAVSAPWHQFFDRLVKMLSLSRPWELPSYTVAGVPVAAEHEGSIVYVSNEAGGKTLAFSDGTNWRRVQDRNVIS